MMRVRARGLAIQSIAVIGTSLALCAYGGNSSQAGSAEAQSVGNIRTLETTAAAAARTNRVASVAKPTTKTASTAKVVVPTAQAVKVSTAPATTTIAKTTTSTTATKTATATGTKATTIASTLTNGRTKTTTWGMIATQNARFTVAGTKTVRFGTGSSWVEKTMIGTGSCDAGFFGFDPAPTSLKECDGPTPIVVPPLRTPPVPVYPAAVGNGNPAVNLATLSTPAAAVMQYVGPTALCGEGFTAGPALTATSPVSIPTGGGAFFSSSDVARWLVRIAGSPFVSANDYKQGSPGDWARVLGNANTFVTSGDIPLTPNSLTQEGVLTRDAAFAALVGNQANQASMITAVRNHLISMAQSPSNNFAATLCYRAFNGTAPGGDAWMAQAIWINRYTFIYDLIRSKLSTSDRLIVENWLRQQAYFFAGELDYDLQALFPNRLAGDYSVRQRDAAPTDQTPYLSALMDTNGDCYVNAGDIQTPFPVYAYVNSAGTFGPRLSVLSQWYNNRRSDLAAAVGNVGVLLNDTTLVNRSKRYFMEWITWGVYPDGSEGEYARSGNYCTPQQGLIYAQNNIQPLLQLATWLKARGDTSLIDFNTNDGEWGSQVPAGQPPKNMELVVSTQLKLFMGTLQWYQPEPWLATQNPRSATFVGTMQSHYQNTGPAIDNFQELGLLIGEYVLPNQPIRGFLLRDPRVTNLPFPTSTGDAIATGQGVWADVFGALPGMFLWEL